jgi:hypothetical protein
MQVRLVTCREMPCPDPDEPLLVEAIRRRGLEVSVASWDDEAASWAGTFAVLRSTWNYVPRYAAFLEWVDRASREAVLHNPAPLVRWSSHKRYLLDLASDGLPVVPTALLERGDRSSLASVLAARGWRDVVVKPAVSAASFATLRFPGPTDEGERHLRSLLADRDVLVQPYLPSVEGHGERSLVFVDGELTHAMRKEPRLSAGAWAATGPHPVPRDEVELAEAVMTRVGGRRLYARVDLARDASGCPRLMELELVEPSLYLTAFPPAAERLAAAIERRVRATDRDAGSVRPRCD